ncbi:MAG: M56 family metallopeptidase [Eubacterium sp.]|nr:M56 family metallopeptidase [Eubacterium sp.]
MVCISTIALLSFVMPFYRIASLVDNSENYFRNYKILVFEDLGSYEYIVGKIRKTGMIEYLSSIWLLGVIYFFIMYVCKYFYLLHRVQANKFYMEGTTWLKIFNRLKDEKNIKNVRLVCCYAVFTPCSIGIKNRSIVIPASMMNAFNEEEMEFILQHELYHILHMDLLKKLFVMLLSCLNWFNPQFRSLRINLFHWLESAADEAVTNGFAFNKRLKYSQLIAKVIELERASSMAAGCSANFRGEKTKKNIRRSKKIMQKKERSGIWGKAAVVSAALFSLISGNVVAKAADTPIHQMFSKNVDIVKSSEIEQMEPSDIVFHTIDACTAHDDLNECIEFDPGIVQHEEPSQAEPRHIHKTEDIILKKHEKYQNNSCKTTYYKGYTCTSCGSAWKGNKINSVIMEICTH